MEVDELQIDGDGGWSRIEQRGASSMGVDSRITQLENANKELQEIMQKVIEEKDDYCEQLKRTMEEMMKHFEDRMRS